MLKLTKKADYGLIALKHLAGNQPDGSSAKVIADAYGIPLPLLAKVLQKLARHGLLQSVHGTNGGYRLTRAPGSISALDVIQAIEGTTLLASCFPGDRGCRRSGICSVREPLRRIHAGILGLLAGITIADLAEDSGGAPEHAAPRYEIEVTHG